jgi:hypothetical protein
MDVLKIKDREGVVHELQAPPIWLNIMELVKRMNFQLKELVAEICALLANVMF